MKRYSNISEVYRSCLHSLGTRSAVEFLKVFTTTGDANHYRASSDHLDQSAIRTSSRESSRTSRDRNDLGSVRKETSPLVGQSVQSRDVHTPEERIEQCLTDDAECDRETAVEQGRTSRMIGEDNKIFTVFHYIL